MVRALGLYWVGSNSTHHCWALTKSFISSLVVWSMTKNNAFGGEKQNKKSNGEQSDLCDLEQVALKPQLQVHHCLSTWYHSLLWGDTVEAAKLARIFWSPGLPGPVNCTTDIRDNGYSRQDYCHLASHICRFHCSIRGGADWGKSITVYSACTPRNWGNKLSF